MPPAKPEPSNTHTCFFYGTLMAPSVLSRVTAHSTHTPHVALSPRPALLPSYRRHRVRAADYPAIVPTTTTSAFESNGTSTGVRGTCVSGLTDRDVWRLDVFEGSEYERRRVTVNILTEAQAEQDKDGTSNGGEGERGDTSDERVEAWTYIWIAGQEKLEDAEWDFEAFRREKLWRWDGGQREEYAEIEEAERERERQNGKELEGDPTGGRAVYGGFEEMVGGGGKGESEREREKVAEEVVRSAV